MDKGLTFWLTHTKLTLTRLSVVFNCVEFLNRFYVEKSNPWREKKRKKNRFFSPLFDWHSLHRNSHCLLQVTITICAFTVLPGSFFSFASVSISTLHLVLALVIKNLFLLLLLFNDHNWVPTNRKFEKGKTFSYQRGFTNGQRSISVKEDNWSSRWSVCCTHLHDSGQLKGEKKRMRKRKRGVKDAIV